MPVTGLLIKMNKAFVKCVICSIHPEETMKHAKRAFTMFELVVVIAVIAVVAATIIPEFSGMFTLAKENIAFKEVRSAIPEYIADYGLAETTCLYNFDESHGYYVFTFSKGKIEYAGDITPSVTQSNADFVGTGSEWYAFYPKPGYEHIKLHYIEDSKACGSSRYTGFFLDISNDEGKEAQCSFGGNDSGNVVSLYGNITASKFMLSGGESILLNDYQPVNTQNPPIFNNGGGNNTGTPENPHWGNGDEVYTIKNIIYIIPDGAGWDIYDLAGKIKADLVSKEKSGINGAATPSTTGAISEMTVNGLYLDNFIIGTAKATLAEADNGSFLTDSAAGVTTIASGTKTQKDKISSDIEMKPIPSIFEICNMSGKSTGMVTTNSWVDATPAGFLAHSDKPASKHKYYQREITYQMLYSGIDILLASGTDNGTYTKNNGFLHSLHASHLGYYIVNSFKDLEEAVEDGETRIWSNFLEGNNSSDDKDNPSNHIKFDIHAEEGDLTLLKMTKSALKVLSQNINDKDGFFLTIEAGAIDFGGENLNLAEAVGEFLSFDETFAYCVDWAKKRTDTIIVAYPNYDSGGFDIKDSMAVNEENSAFDTDGNNILSRDEILNCLSDAIIEGKTINMAYYVSVAEESRRASDIPLWVYAPDWCSDSLLRAMGLPNGENTGNANTVRTGKFNSDTVINTAYSTDNTKITEGVLSVCGLMSVDYAKGILFTDATSYVKNINWSECTITLDNGEVIPINSRVWFNSKDDWKIDSNATYFTEGRCVYMFDCSEDPYAYENNYKNGTVYLPKSFLVSRGYIHD